MTLYTATATLILVMDPLGNIPIFLTILKNFDFRAQQRIIIRELIIAYLVLLTFLFCGQYIMRGLGLTASALSIAGSLILFLIAVRMIFPPPVSSQSEINTAEPYIVPLAIPLTAGPSAIAIVMLFVARAPEQLTLFFSAITIASALFLVIMILSRYLMRLLGDRVLIAVERLMGMILTAIAVQMFLGSSPVS